MVVTLVQLVLQLGVLPGGTTGICDSGIINDELAFLAGGDSQSEESESITIGLSGVV